MIGNISHQRFRSKAVVAVTLITLIAAVNVAGGQQLKSTLGRAKRAVTILDAISMTTLGESDYINGAPATGLVAHFSPDARQFVVVLKKGNLTSNTNTYSLLYWRTEDIVEARRPDVLLQLSTSSNQ